MEDLASFTPAHICCFADSISCTAMLCVSSCRNTGNLCSSRGQSELEIVIICQTRMHVGFWLKLKVTCLSLSNFSGQSSQTGRWPGAHTAGKCKSQFIHYITSFSMYFHIVDLHPLALSWSFYSVKPTKCGQVVVLGPFSRTGQVGFFFFWWIKPVTSCLSFTSNAAAHFPLQPQGVACVS